MDNSGFSYLEAPNGARARAWVERQNERTIAELEGDRRFKDYLQIAAESERASDAGDTAGLLAKPRRMWLHRDWVYQLWSDALHPRGIWRRVSLRDYLARKPKWQVLLDMDALSATDREDWMFIEPIFSPGGHRCLLQLSLGGSIRTAWREFDVDRAAFVADGFQIPPSTINNQVVWRTDDTVLLSTDFGPGTVNRAGSPLVVKEWSRGQPLSEAKEILRGRPEDVAVDVNSIDALDGGLEEDKNGTRVVHIVHTDRAYNSVWWRLTTDGRLVRLTPPLAGTVPFLYRDQYVIVLKQDWQTGGKVWRKDTVVAVPAAQIGDDNPRVDCVLQPERDTSVLFVGAKSRSGLLLFGSRLGYSRLWRSTFTKDAWTTDRVPLPDHGMIMQGAADIHSDTAFVRYESFLQPPSLYSVDMAHNAVAPVVGAPADFRTDAFVVEEREAVSPDGVLVPYSLVRPRDFSFNGASSALVVGYGSRGGTQLPAYSAALGRLWLEQGGVYVLANIRGGQERGREWAVSGVGRQHTYEDMIAVTDDLVRLKVTAAKRIGFMGHSAGGLLGGVMLTQRPDLFGAVVLKAPVLDQFRMDQIALGQTAWEGEFGSPDIPQERAFLERTSPFQNLRAQTNFPKPLIITSTTDETVSPAQARTFAAKMESLGMPFLFYESSDGGHGLTSTPAQKNRLEALIYVYLARQLLDQRVASGRE